MTFKWFSYTFNQAGPAFIVFSSNTLFDWGHGVLKRTECWCWADSPTPFAPNLNGGFGIFVGAWVGDDSVELPTENPPGTGDYVWSGILTPSSILPFDLANATWPPPDATLGFLTIWSQQQSQTSHAERAVRGDHGTPQAFFNTSYAIPTFGHPFDYNVSGMVRFLVDLD